MTRMNNKTTIIPTMHLDLRAVMKAQGVSVMELSKRSGLSRAAIYFIIARPPVQLRLDTLARICTALSIDPNTLLKIKYEEVSDDAS